MQIDPFNENYTDMKPIWDSAWSQEETLAAADLVEGEKVTAISQSREALKKLQDDLRKAGYKKRR